MANPGHWRCTLTMHPEIKVQRSIKFGIFLQIPVPQPRDIECKSLGNNYRSFSSLPPQLSRISWYPERCIWKQNRPFIVVSNKESKDNHWFLFVWPVSKLFVYSMTLKLLRSREPSHGSLLITSATFNSMLHMSCPLDSPPRDMMHAPNSTIVFQVILVNIKLNQKFFLKVLHPPPPSLTKINSYQLVFRRE